MRFTPSKPSYFRGVSHDENSTARQVSREENLAMVRESVDHLKRAGKEVMLDLEHFFDGYKANADYTMQVSCTIRSLPLLSRTCGRGGWSYLRDHGSDTQLCRDDMC